MSDEKRGQRESGHMSATSGRVIYRVAAELSYVAVLEHEGSETEHAFATMREAEAFIKRNTPVPQGKLSALYDRAAGED